MGCTASLRNQDDVFNYVQPVDTEHRLLQDNFSYATSNKAFNSQKARDSFQTSSLNNSLTTGNGSRRCSLASRVSSKSQRSSFNSKSPNELEDFSSTIKEIHRLDVKPVSEMEKVISTYERDIAILSQVSI